MSRTAVTDRHAIHSDTPLRLADAVEIAFPSGGMTVSGLRREIARGRLEAELIAGKHFVTLEAIKDMRERCRVEVQGRVSGGTSKEPRGQLLIGSGVSGRDLALAKIGQRRKLLQNT